MRRYLWILVPVVFAGIVFRSFIFGGLIPIPADILLGGYYPWLEEKWGQVVGVGVKNNVPADVFSIIYPWRIVGMEQLTRGVLPLWDNTILLGVPLLANFQSAVLAPVNVLFFFFSHLDAWSIQIVLQPILAAVAMYFFARKQRLSVWPSLFAGLVYAFSGYAIVWMQYNTIVYTMAFIPWVFFALDDLVFGFRLRSVLLLGLSVGLQLFFGYPLMTIFTLGFGGLYWIYRLLTRRERIFPSVFAVGMGVFVGLCLAAVQVLPGMQLSGLSVRAYDTVAEAGSVKYLPIEHLLTFFVPDYFGHPVTANYVSQGSYENFAFSISAVAIVLLVAALSTRTTWNRRYLVFVLLALIAILFALDNPLSRVVGMSLNSAVNARALVFVTLSGAILSAIGLQAVLDRKIKLWQLCIGVAIFVHIVGVTLFALFLVRNTLGGIGVAELRTNEFSRSSMIALRNAAIPLVLAGTTVVIVLFASRKIVLIGVFGLLLISIVLGSDKYFTFMKPETVFPEMKTFSSLQALKPDGRIGFEKAELIPANSWSVYGLRSPVGQDALGLLNTSRYIDLLNTGSVTDKTLTRYHQITNEGIRSPLYAGLDAEYFLALNRNEIAMIVPEGKPHGWLVPSTFTELENLGTIRVYRNTLNLGSAWFGSRVLCVHNVQQMQEQMKLKHYTLDTSLILGCGTDQAAVKSGHVRSVRSRADRLEFETDSEAGNYLVVSQAWYPGWRAYVDGRQVSTTIANLALTGIEVPSGKHRIVLQYLPRVFYVGLLVSFITCMGMVGAWLLRKKI